MELAPPLWEIMDPPLNTTPFIDEVTFQHALIELLVNRFNANQKLLFYEYSKSILQSSGIPVASWEIDELLETLTGKDGDTSINYQ